MLLYAFTFDFSKIHYFVALSIVAWSLRSRARMQIHRVLMR